MHPMPGAMHAVSLLCTNLNPAACVHTPARQVTRRLVVAAGLAVACLLGHAAHMWPGTLPAAFRLLASDRAHAALSLFAMLGDALFTVCC